MKLYTIRPRLLDREPGTTWLHAHSRDEAIIKAYRGWSSDRAFADFLPRRDEDILLELDIKEGNDDQYVIECVFGINQAELFLKRTHCGMSKDEAQKKAIAIFEKYNLAIDDDSRQENTWCVVGVTDVFFSFVVVLGHPLEIFGGLRPKEIWAYLIDRRKTGVILCADEQPIDVPCTGDYPFIMDELEALVDDYRGESVDSSQPVRIRATREEWKG